MKNIAALIWLAACPAFAIQPDFVIEENCGQAGPGIEFVGRGDGYLIAFSSDEVLFSPKSGGTLALRFAGQTPDSRWEALDLLPTTSSYFLGNDPNLWVRNIPHSRRVIRRDVYPGIDVVFYETGGRIEYDFQVSPRADPGLIRLAWRGGSRQSLNPQGDLLIQAGVQTLVSRKPVMFQEDRGARREIPGSFLLSADGTEVSFSIGPHDPNLPLTIDPTVDALAFVGGTGNDRITAIFGNTVAGVTNSLGLGGFGGLSGGTDVFTWDGTTYSVYGGTGDEEPTAIAYIGGSLVIVGWTSSHDFPGTGIQSPQRTFGGGNTDGFIISITGGFSILSSYLGGSGDDRILALAPLSANPPANPPNNSGYGYILAGETTSSDFPVRLPVQPALAGGKDGFLTHIGANGQIVESTYWGGSGDDSILALDTTANTCWFAGRTNSSDLPTVAPLQPSLAGMTDAFLGRLNISAVPATLDFATYYGGSGNDEIRALKIGPDSWIWTGGNTTSPDLPLAQPSQPALGGDTDAWLARFDPARFTPAFVTYFGGSAHDELTSIVHNPNGDLIAAGFTNSADLPLQNPLQSQPGGADDGFLARFDSYGQPQMSTYAGGPGNDRIRALTASPTSTGSIIAVGESDSTSLPFLSPAGTVPATNAGQLDGLFLRFHEDGIYALPLTLGNGMTVPLAVILLSPNSSGVPITVRSTDPSRLLVNQGAFSTATSFQLSAFAGDATVDVIISAPGFAPRHVPVTLRPSFLVNSYTSPIPLAANTLFNATLGFATTDPATGQPIYQQPRDGIDTAVSFVTSDYSVVQAVASYNSPQEVATLRGFRIGSASMAIVSPVFPVRGQPQLYVSVSAPAAILSPPDLVVGKMLQTTLPLNLSPLSPTSGAFNVTLTSEDPARLLVSATSSTIGSASITIPYVSNFGAVPNVWLQGRDSSGVVRVRLDVAGAAPVYVNVALAPSTAALATPAETLNSYIGVHHDPAVTSASLKLWSTRPTFGLVVQIDGPTPPGFTVREQLPSPESVNNFTIVSSDLSVVSCFYRIGFDIVNGYVYQLFSVGLLRAGTATLNVTGSGFRSSSIQVTVLPGNLPLSTSSFTLGKGLQTLIRFDAFNDFPLNVDATVTSADPTRVLVATYQAEESPSVSLKIAGGFYVSALSDSGDVPVTVHATGYPDSTVIIHLAPTTYGLSSKSVATTIGGSPLLSITWSYPNAPANYGQTTPRSNTRFTFATTVSDPNILRNDTPQITFQYSAYLSLFAQNEGVATVTLTSASTAVVDPQFATATVTVTPQRFSFGVPLLLLGKDQQRPVLAPYTYSPGQALTMRSLDPSRVLLSFDPALPGAATLTNVAGTVYVQALADSGDVPVIASVPGFYDASLTVRLAPTAFGIFDSYANTGTTTGRVGDALSLRVAPLPIDPASGSPIVQTDTTLRGGLPPFQLNLLTSNPAVGRLLSPIAFIGGLSQNTTQLRADSLGSTDISVVPAAGYVDGGAALHRTVQIAPPHFTLQSFTLGKDVEYYAQLSFTGVDSTLPPFTVASSNPALVLVSDSPTNVGAASVTINRGQMFVVQSLAAAGEVTLTVTASGFDPITASVHLEPSYFTFDQGFFQVQPAAQYIPPGFAYGVGVYISEPSASSSFFNSNRYLRPGIGSVTVPVDSSNPSVLAVVPPVVFQPGSNQASAALNSLAPGTATITLGTPNGFSTAPDPFRTKIVTVGQ